MSTCVLRDTNNTNQRIRSGDPDVIYGMQIFGRTFWTRSWWKTEDIQLPAVADHAESTTTPGQTELTTWSMNGHRAAAAGWICRWTDLGWIEFQEIQNLVETEIGGCRAYHLVATIITGTPNWEQALALGCFKNQLFLRFLFLFFILCTNIIKSSEKKFGSIWRSFDPPTRGSYFVWEI